MTNSPIGIASQVNFLMLMFAGIIFFTKLIEINLVAIALTRYVELILYFPSFLGRFRTEKELFTKI